MVGGTKIRVIKTLYITLFLVTTSFINLLVFERLYEKNNVNAVTLIVDDDGNGDYKSIQAAIDNASSDDTIHVWSGIYLENVMVNKSLTIIGNGPMSTTIDGGGNDNVIRITANWVNISGFKITNRGSSSSDSGIDLYNVDYCTVSNNICSDNRNNGVNLYNSSNNEISNNTCTNNGNGIKLMYSPNNILVNNNWVSNNNRGVWLYYSSDITLINNTFSNNQEGIKLSSSSNNILKNNNFVNNVDNGIWFYNSSNNIVNYNSYLKNGDGIKLSLSSNNMFINNNCSNNNNFGINFWRSSNNIIDNCTFFLNTNHDLFLENNSRNNLVINGTYESIYIFDSSSELIIKNYLHIHVKDTNGFPIQGADVKVENNKKIIYSTTYYGGINPKTNKFGQVKWILITSKIYQKSSTFANITIVTVRFDDLVFWKNIRDVDMSTSHFEYFYPNSLPNKIVLDNPLNNSYFNNPKLKFKWIVGTDKNNDTLTYYIQVAEIGSDWTSLISSSHVESGKLSWDIPIPLLSDNYQWRVCANDGYGNGSWSNIWRIIIDIEIPIANVPSAYSTLNNTGSINWTWMPSLDTISGIDGYYVTITSGPDKKSIVKDVWTNNSWFKVTGLEDGDTYFCKIKAKNGVGTNSSYSNYSEGIIVDTSAPTSPKQILIEPVEWTSINLFSIDWINPSDYSGIKTGAYYYIGNESPNSQSVGIWTSKKPFNITNVPEGENNIYIWFKDIAGNKNYQNYGKESLKLDTTSPTIYHTPIINGTKDKDVIITAEVTDLGSGLDDIILYFKKPIESNYSQLQMKKENNIYTSKIAGEHVTIENLEYYIEASDSSSPSNIVYFGRNGETEIRPTSSTDIDVLITAESRITYDSNDNLLYYYIGLIIFFIVLFIIITGIIIKHKKKQDKPPSKEI